MTDKIGPYEIRGELGRGAMAVVWRGWDPKLAREVAIKEPLTGGMPGVAAADLAERFVREGQAAARLNHPGIVAIYNADVYDGRAALVMELVEGEPLSRVIARGPLPPETVSSYLDQLLYAIAYAHSRGVVHRDIKPDNVFVTDQGGIKLGDFGIARIGSSASMTQIGSTLGTPGYMAPEQVTGSPADERSDIFSAAAMGYEMLTGRNPFGAHDTPDPTAVMYRIVHVELPPVDQVVAGVPAGLAAAITRGTAKDPAQRFQSAEEMRAMLRGMTDASSWVTQPVAAPSGSGDYGAAAAAVPDYGVTAAPGSGDWGPATVAAPGSGDYGAAAQAVAPPRAKRSGLRTGLIVGGVVFVLLSVFGICSLLGMCALFADTNPPAVAITWPKNNSAYAAGQKFEVSVTASDKEGMDSVVLFANGKEVATLDKPPYKKTLTAPSSGTMKIEAVAHDTGGNEQTARVTIKVEEFPPENTVSYFWQSLSAKQPEEAWGSMTPRLQQAEGGYDTWEASAKDLMNGKLELTSATLESLSGPSAKVRFTVLIADDPAAAGTPVSGTMSLTQVNAVWLIDDMAVDGQ